MSLPEVVLWGRLRRGGLTGVQFRRQHPLGPSILDFFCPTVKVAVEMDGSGHNFAGQVNHDGRRDTWLSEQGVRVLRVSAAEVSSDTGLEDVLSTISAAAAPSTPLRAVLLPRLAGEEL